MIRGYRVVIACSCMLFVGCASTTSNQRLSVIAPESAVMKAAASAPDSVTGKFALGVQSSAILNSVTYLNSELDYRDQRNLTIAITPEAIPELTMRLGSAPVDALKGKRIEVEGKAKRVKIVFSHGGVATDKYYYQTHVTVTSAGQIKVLGN